MPNTPGTYEFRLFPNNGYTRRGDESSDHRELRSGYVPRSVGLSRTYFTENPTEADNVHRVAHRVAVGGDPVQPQSRTLPRGAAS